MESLLLTMCLTQIASFNFHKPVRWILPSFLYLTDVEIAFTRWGNLLQVIELVSGRSRMHTQGPVLTSDPMTFIGMQPYRPVLASADVAAPSKSLSPLFSVSSWPRDSRILTLSPGHHQRWPFHPYLYLLGGTLPLSCFLVPDSWSCRMSTLGLI